MMATVAADEHRHATEDEPRANQAGPWIAGALSVVVPGLGQAYARRYMRGIVWFSPVVGALVVGGVAVDLSLRGLVGAALDPSVLWGLFWLNIAAAAWRIISAVDAFALVHRSGPVSVGATALAAGWMMLGMLVVVPHLVVGRYTLDALSLVETVFVADDATAPIEPVIPIGTDADIVPDPVATPTGAESDVEYRSVFDTEMWDPEAVAIRIRIEGNRTAPSQAPFLPFNERVGERRITILIAGGDAGPGRGGLRTDSIIVASIHTGTGKAALFSFPRNLGSIPLPEKFEDAFEEYEKSLAPEPAPLEEGEEEIPEWESCKCFPEQLNSIYPFTRRWTSTYPNEIDPGMAALRDVIVGLMGANIDYYILVDMAAFVDLVDAIGGIDVNVLQPLQAEVSPPREGDPWATVDVDVGWNHLDGSEALAYARARKGSSDYVRMERQRCMLRGLAARADPFTLLRSFPAIVDALEGSVVTDIPRSFASEFIATAADLEFGDIVTVGFTHGYWLEERDHLYHPIPDVERIQTKVREVFAGQDSGDIFESGESECDA